MRAFLLLALLSGEPDTERKVELDLALASRTRVEVVHSQGELSILPAATGQAAHAELRLSASGSGEKAERAFLAGFRLEVERLEDRLVVRTILPAAQSKPPEMSYAASLRLWLPPSIAVRASNRYGRLVVEGREAEVEAAAHLGPLELRGIRGAVHGSVDYDDARVRDVVGDVVLETNSEVVEVREVDGDVQVINRFGTVRVEDVRGRAEIENRKGGITVSRIRDGVDLTSPFGAVLGRGLGGVSEIRSNNARIDLADCSGSVTIVHRHGEIALQSIAGDVDVSGDFVPTRARALGGDLRWITSASDLDLDGVAGEARIEGETGSIRILGVEGRLEAHGRGGLMQVVLDPDAADAPPTPWVLENRSSPIELFLPPDPDVTLELRSTLGVVESRFPGLQVRMDGKVATAKQTLGTGRRSIRATGVGAAVRVLRTDERDERER